MLQDRIYRLMFDNYRREIRGVTEGTRPAPNGGSSTTSRLEIMPSSSDHNATYYCKAKNEYINKSTSDGLRISIQCKSVKSKL